MKPPDGGRGNNRAGEAVFSLAARKILRALPLDGTRASGIVLERRLKLAHKKFVAARDELSQAGLIVVGRGRTSGICRIRGAKAQTAAPPDPHPLPAPAGPETAPQPALSLAARKILRALPLDGTRASGVVLERRLKLAHKKFVAARDELSQAGLITVGRRRVIGIGRVRSGGGTPPPAAGPQQRVPNPPPEGDEMLPA